MYEVYQCKGEEMFEIKKVRIIDPTVTYTYFE